MLLHTLLKGKRWSSLGNNNIQGKALVRKCVARFVNELLPRVMVHLMLWAGVRRFWRSDWKVEEMRWFCSQTQKVFWSEKLGKELSSRSVWRLGEQTVH